MNQCDSSIILMQYPEFESVRTVQQLLDQMERIRSEALMTIPEAAKHVYQLCTCQLLGIGKSLVLQHTPDYDIRQDSSLANELKTRVWTPFVIETKQALRKMPLYQHKLEIQMGLNDRSVLILKSSTGSGKTTQLPQYLSQVTKGAIVCSQPRKLGTINVSERVKEEAGTYLSVSTIIRMEELPRDPKGVLFITERALLNILLESVQREEWLPWMSVLILDEAHERAMDCDVILGLVKESILPNRPDFKLIVASATVDMSKLTAFLSTALVLEFCDPLYPINIQYVSDYFSYFGATLQILDEQVHDKLKAAETETILVFLTGMEEILQAHDHFHRVCNEEIQQGKLHLKMLHGRLTFSEQSEIVNPGLTTGLRVIFSTNVAESSVTVPAVTTVIDSCRQKTRRYNSERGVLEDKVVLISKDSAGQRAGRCGRTCPGTCIRILTLQEYEALPMCREPMILQSHLGLIILKFTKYRLSNLADFPMQDNPSYQDVLKHLGELLTLGALSAEEELEITKLGHFILNLEIEPSYGKVLFTCLQSGLGLVEMMSIVSIVKNGSYIFEKFDIPFIETREVVHSLVNNLVESVFAICNAQTNDPLNTLLNAVSNSLKSIYVLVNPIVHLGDVFLYLFAYRQFELVRCQNCYFELRRNISSIGFMAAYSSDNQCANCFELKWNWCRHFEVVHGSMKFIRNSFKELVHSLKRMNVSMTEALPKEVVQDEALLALLSTFTFSSVDLQCHMILQRNAWKLDSLILHLRDAYSSHLQEYIGKALCSVFHSKACIFRKIRGEGVNAVSFGLVSLSTKQVLLAHPSSPYVKQLMQNPQMDVPQYFLYNDIIEQERLFIKTITPIRLEWLQEVASAWLKDIEFTTQFEDFAMEEVTCVGPAIMGCFSRKNLLEIEEEMHQNGAPMALILLDFTNFALKVWAPRIVLSIAVALVKERVQSAVTRLIEASRYHQSFRKSAVLLVMKAGAIVVNVSSLHNSVKYSLKGLRNYANTYQLNKELSVLFPYQLATLSPKLMSYGKQATVYFSSESEAEKAQQILRKSPLPGFNSLITSLIPATNSTINADFAIKIHLPSDVPDGKIKAVLDMFGEVGNFFIYRNPICTKAIVRFTKTNSAKFMLSNYRKISQELFGSQWSNRIELVDDGIPIPKALVHMDKDNLVMEIERISKEFSTHIHFQEGGHPRLYVKSKSGTVPNELVEKIVFLLREETISAPAYIIDELMDRTRFLCDGHLVDWYKWRSWLKVDIMVHAGKSALSVVGLPLNRRLALDEIASKVLEISQSITRRELTFLSSFEMRSFLDGKVRLLREHNVKWFLNQRNNSIFLEGRKQAVESILSKEPSRIFRSKLEKSCQLCYSPLTVETRTVLDLCGHQYHSECLQDQIKAQMSESPFPDLPLKCAECGVPLTQKDWYSVLDISDVEALYTASLIYFINTNPKFCWCETANCNFVYNLDDFKKQSIRKCPQCKMIWCLRCHRLVLSLAHDLQCEKGWEDEDNRKNRLWLLEFTKSCPRCKFRIEKNKGCNHMKCPKCFQDFCFICDARLTSNPMEHYSVQGTLCYQKMMVDI